MKKEKIAIIGIGMIVPKALDKEQFWQNVKEGRNCISEVPPDHWDSSLYYSPDRKAKDKTYTKIGGFIEGFKFNSIKYRIPPVTGRQISRLQQMVLEATSMALDDAGYSKKTFSSARTAVVFGNAMGPTVKDKTDMRVYRFKTADLLHETPTFSSLPKSQQENILKEYENQIDNEVFQITEDTLPGELSNVIAGRVASVFNFNGPNMTIDAACASSLAALDYAVSGLREGKFDVAVTGGADDMVQPAAFVRFSKLGALSADGSYAFDERANGFVMAEAVSVYILKRLSDAEKDGDKRVVAGDIKLPADVEIANPNQVICHIDDPKKVLKMNFVVESGRGYLTIDESSEARVHSDMIAIDAVFSPVLRVRYKVENTRVGQDTNLQQLTLTVDTDGTITPKEAFEEAAAILVNQYTALAGSTVVESTPAPGTRQEEDDSGLMLPIEELDLSARTANALLNNDIKTIRDLVMLSESDLKDLKGFGTKALDEVREKLMELNI